MHEVQRMNAGYTADEWQTVRRLMIREIASLETAKNAVVNDGLRDTYTGEQERYTRLADIAHRNYLLIGG